MPTTPMEKGDPRKVSKEDKTAERTATMDPASPESRDDSGGDAGPDKSVSSDQRNGRTSTEDIVQSFDASVSLSRKKSNSVEESSGSSSVRESKRKTSVYSLVNFDAKGANRRSNSKQDSSGGSTAESSAPRDSEARDSEAGSDSPCSQNDQRYLFVC